MNDVALGEANAKLGGPPVSIYKLMKLSFSEQVSIASRIPISIF